MDVNHPKVLDEGCKLSNLFIVYTVYVMEKGMHFQTLLSKKTKGIHVSLLENVEGSLELSKKKLYECKLSK